MAAGGALARGGAIVSGRYSVWTATSEGDGPVRLSGSIYEGGFTGAVRAARLAAGYRPRQRPPVQRRGVDLCIAGETVTAWIEAVRS